MRLIFILKLVGSECDVVEGGGAIRGQLVFLEELVQHGEGEVALGEVGLVGGPRGGGGVVLAVLYLGLGGELLELGRGPEVLLLFELPLLRLRAEEVVLGGRGSRCGTGEECGLENKLLMLFAFVLFRK